MTRETSVAVVGGGAAGLTAAHFLARAGLSVEIVGASVGVAGRTRWLTAPTILAAQRLTDRPGVQAAVRAGDDPEMSRRRYGTSRPMVTSPMPLIASAVRMPNDAASRPPAAAPKGMPR